MILFRKEKVDELRMNVLPRFQSNAQFAKSKAQSE